MAQVLSMKLHRNRDHLKALQLFLMNSRDPERLAKIRSGKLQVDEEEVRSVIHEDALAMAAWDPYHDGIMDHG